MTASGTYNWALDNASVTVEAFERCGLLPAQLTRHHWLSSRTSLNLVLQQWSVRGPGGVNLWKVMGPTALGLVQGQAQYALSNQTVSVLDCYYSLIDAGGPGINIDRIMIPVSRTEYAEYPNKLAQGQPTTFWHDKQFPNPQMYLYQCPQFSVADGYDVYYYWLSRIEDANQTGGETPDVNYLFLNALCADLAVALANKPSITPDVSPTRRLELKQEAAEAWALASGTDREDTPIAIRPNVGKYWLR